MIPIVLNNEEMDDAEIPIWVESEEDLQKLIALVNHIKKAPRYIGVYSVKAPSQYTKRVPAPGVANPLFSKEVTINHDYTCN